MPQHPEQNEKEAIAMQAKLPHQRSAHMTYLYLSVPKHLKKFLREFRTILKRNYQIINYAGEERYTCGQGHDHRNPNWKPFQHLERYCLQEGLDDFEVRGKIGGQSLNSEL